MAHDEKSELRRALDDLNQGLRALLGAEPGSPDLIAELLEGGDPGPRARRHRTARIPRSDQPRPRVPVSSKLRLVRDDRRPTRG